MSFAYGWSPDGINGTSSCSTGGANVGFDVTGIVTDSANDASTSCAGMPGRWCAQPFMVGTWVGARCGRWTLGQAVAGGPATNKPDA